MDVIVFLDIIQEHNLSNVHRTSGYEHQSCCPYHTSEAPVEVEDKKADHARVEERACDH